MKKGARQHGGPAQITGGRELQHTSSPEPGKVTRTSKLSPSRESAVQRQVAAPTAGGAPPQARSLSDFTMDPSMDAAHRGVTALAERGQEPVQAHGRMGSASGSAVQRKEVQRHDDAPGGIEERPLAGDDAGPVGGDAADLEAPFRSERFQGDPALQRVRDGAATLGPGSSGLPVRKLQQALIDLGHGAVTVNGNYDAPTQAAVRAFQQAETLTVSGSVDGATMTRLDERFASHQPHATLARGHVPAQPLAGTRSLDGQDRTAIDAALNPAPAVDPNTGQPPVFRPSVGGQQYADRLRRLLDARVTEQYQRIGRSGRGDADRARPGSLYQWSSIEQIADESKRVTDSVFSNYAQGPALRHATGGLRDRWEEQSASIAAMSPQQQQGVAEWRVQKILNEDERVAELNREHGADLTRSPAQGIAQGVRDQIVQRRTAELLEIHKGWPASAGNGQVQLQRFMRNDTTENRRQFWRLFQTVIHEYLHTLTHARYAQYARSLGDPRGHTLREGVTDVLTKTVWSTVQGNITPTLRQRVEGPFHDPAVPMQPPPLSTYPQTQQAEQVISTCGLRNMYAAYFDGHTNLIGGP